jgi:beta-lactamase class A
MPTIVMLTLLASAQAGYEQGVRPIAAASGAEVAVAFRTVGGRDELLIDADKPFHAASTMKVPVMIELFRQASAKKLSLDEPLGIQPGQQ